MKLHKTVRNFVKRPFVRSVITVASGTAAAQAISMGSAPIITRLYGPEIFGLQGLFLSTVTLLSTLAALNYPTAIVLPKSESDAIGLARLSVFIGLGIALLTAAALLFVGDSFFRVLNAGAIADYAPLISVAMFLSVLGGILTQLLIRNRAFSLTARFAILTSFILGSLKIGMGIVNPSATGLIVANLIGVMIGISLTYFGWRKVRLLQNRSIEPSVLPKSLRQLACRYRDFPLLRTPQNLINAFSQSLPVFLLAKYFGASYAGQYTIVISVLGVPASLIGGSVMTVFYPRITEALHKGENARALIVRATLSMAGLGIVPFLIVMLAGPYLFQFAFGENWRTAGIYAQWLSGWIFLQYINRPAVSAIPALGLQGGLLTYEIFSTGTKVLALWIGFAVFSDPIVAVAIFSVVGAIAYIWLILWVIRKSNLATGTEK